MRPRRGTSQGSSQGYTSVIVDLRPALEAEFENHIYEDADLKDRAFIKIPTKSHIQKFLDESPLYDSKQKRWTAVPEHPQSESDLYRPLTAVIQAIIDHKEFGLSTLRKARDTHNIGMYHNEGAITQSQSSGVPVHIGDSAKEPVRSSPDISIMGVVPDENIANNFTIFEDKAKSRYNLVLSPVEVKREAANVNLQTNIKQVSVYARQVFRHQSNRFMVNALVMTEKHVYLLVYGRDALHHSTKVNFHEDPATFVRFVLGAASTDGKVAGYDESIYWQNGKRYMKTVDKAGEQVIYPIVDNVPFFDQRSILGRGTCCWCVEAADRARFIIKDSWRSSKRSPESDLMQMVEELDGVGQMVAFEDRIAVISELRDLDLDALKEKADNAHKFQDRILSRLILICYNGSIENFETRAQLLHAFRDAVAGHQNLWNAGILHRDVSLNNIMRGQHTAIKKNRGVLIDLDMAILLARLKSLSGSDFRTGTRAYQSVNVLGAYVSGSKVWPHGVMDDLESFFYVLCWICCGYNAPREILRPFPEDLLLWEDGYAKTARNTKIGLYQQEFNLPVSPYFGDIFLRLLSNLHLMFHTLFAERFLSHLGTFSHPTSDETQLAASTAYAKFLGYIDTAITAVEAEEQLQKKCAAEKSPDLSNSNILIGATPTQANFPQNQASKKRSSQGDEDLDSEHRNKRANASRIPSRLSQRSDVD